VQEDLADICANAPGGHHGLTRLASPKPLGNAVDEQVDDPMEAWARASQVLSVALPIAGSFPQAPVTEGYARSRLAQRWVMCTANDANHPRLSLLIPADELIE
jgi:hypothetical protein